MFCNNMPEKIVLHAFRAAAHPNDVTEPGETVIWVERSGKSVILGALQRRRANGVQNEKEMHVSLRHRKDVVMEMKSAACSCLD